MPYASPNAKNSAFQNVTFLVHSDFPPPHSPPSSANIRGDVTWMMHWVLLVIWWNAFCPDTTFTVGLLGIKYHLSTVSACQHQVLWYLGIYTADRTGPMLGSGWAWDAAFTSALWTRLESEVSHHHHRKCVIVCFTSRLKLCVASTRHTHTDNADDTESCSVLLQGWTERSSTPSWNSQA